MRRLVAGCAATTTGTDEVADAGGAGVLQAGLTAAQRAEVAVRAGHVHDLLEADGSLLRDRLTAKAAELRVTVRTLQRWLAGYRSDGEAGLVDAITAELDRLASADVGPADRVFIYYAGHGTQLLLEDDDGHRFPREALLPKDEVHGPMTRYLPDWQLNAAMARIGARCRSATVVLDCCSSAGATRSLSFDTGNLRFWPTPEIQRLPRGEAGVVETVRGVADGLLARVDNCHVVAACQADEKAKEADLDGRTRGHLSRSLRGTAPIGRR